MLLTNANKELAVAVEAEVAEEEIMLLEAEEEEEVAIETVM